MAKSEKVIDLINKHFAEVKACYSDKIYGVEKLLTERIERIEDRLYAVSTMAPTEKKEWIVIYTKLGKQYCLGDVFESPDLAHKAAGNMGAYYNPTVHEITIIE
jgi:hypothetical protein